MTHSPPASVGGRPGCLRLAAGWAALVVLAPVAAVVRWWQRRRRGSAPVVQWSFGGSVIDGGDHIRLDLTVDVPTAREPRTVAALTDVVVRQAEALQEEDDVYHLVLRLPGENEAEWTAVGIRPQELGERFSLSLSHRPYRRRTLLWLALARSRRLEGSLNPRECDPDAPGEPDTMVGSVGPRWAVATALVRAGASTVIRAAFYVPEAARGRAEELLERLRRSLEVDRGRHPRA